MTHCLKWNTISELNFLKVELVVENHVHLLAVIPATLIVVIQRIEETDSVAQKEIETITKILALELLLKATVLQMQIVLLPKEDNLEPEIILVTADNLLQEIVLLPEMEEGLDVQTILVEVILDQIHKDVEEEVSVPVLLKDQVKEADLIQVDTAKDLVAQANSEVDQMILEGIQANIEEDLASLEGIPMTLEGNLVILEELVNHLAVLRVLLPMVIKNRVTNVLEISK
jgi:hypothetical protein